MIEVSEFNGFAIYEDDGASGDFYCRMGRFFASKQVIKELEGPMYDDIHHVWLLAIKDGEIAGFGAVRFDGMSSGVANLTVVYILPAHRRKGLYRHLFTLREQMCVRRGAKVIRGLANPLSKPVFEQNGYQVTRLAGKWTHFQKEVNRAEPDRS